MATHSSILFFFSPQRASLFTAKDLTIATHINSLRTFLLLSFIFLAMSCRKEKQKAKNTPHWSGALGWEETGSVKEVGRERPDIMTHKYTEC